MGETYCGKNWALFWWADPCSIQLGHSVVSDSLQPHALQHPWLPCPSPTPRLYSKPCPLRWCHQCLHIFVYVYTHLIGEGNGTPLQYFCLEIPKDGGAWWAAVYGVARIRHDWATSLSLFTFLHWRRKWQPTPVFLPGESQGREAWLTAIYGVTQSQTRLKRRSSSIHIWWIYCLLFQTHFLGSNVYLQKILVFIDNICSFTWWSFTNVL